MPSNQILVVQLGLAEIVVLSILGTFLSLHTIVGCLNLARGMTRDVYLKVPSQQYSMSEVYWSVF